ncbi:MAG: DUF4956 domain-containing protein [Roseburia sp.]|nr:DUF4956 domain-containing protein [Roseburia sp.]
MLEKIFKSIFSGVAVGTINVGEFLICIAVALGTGALLAFAYAFKTKYSKSFVITLAILPAVIGVVIMLVNGNIGAGIAVAGAFSLVRFRSVPGTAKEITAIFITMCLGLIVGMGFVAYAALFALIMSAILFTLNVLKVWNKPKVRREKTLRITIPEDLNYSEVFDDLFEKYTEKYEIVSVKTTNMGSMFKLTYNIKMKDNSLEKQFIDELRCRNGNLEISVSYGSDVQQPEL